MGISPRTNNRAYHCNLLNIYRPETTEANALFYNSNKHIYPRKKCNRHKSNLCNTSRKCKFQQCSQFPAESSWIHLPCTMVRPHSLVTSRFNCATLYRSTDYTARAQSIMPYHAWVDLLSRGTRHSWHAEPIILILTPCLLPCKTALWRSMSGIWHEISLLSSGLTTTTRGIAQHSKIFRQSYERR